MRTNNSISVKCGGHAAEMMSGLVIVLRLFTHAGQVHEQCVQEVSTTNRHQLCSINSTTAIYRAGPETSTVGHFSSYFCPLRHAQNTRITTEIQDSGKMLLSQIIDCVMETPCLLTHARQVRELGTRHQSLV